MNNNLSFSKAWSTEPPQWEEDMSLAELRETIGSGTADEGTYFNNGSGSFIYCPTCAFHIDIDEVTVYGSMPSNIGDDAPVVSSYSDLWYHEPNYSWMYWDYTGGASGSGSWTPIQAIADEEKELLLGDTWDKFTNFRIKTLADCLENIVKTFINRVERDHGIKLRVTDAYRSIDSQNELYAQGRTQAELDAVGLTNIEARPDLPWATNAIGGHSFHNYGLAIDVVEIKDGEALYENPNWDLIGTIGQSLGFVWGESFNDTPHFQYESKTINDLLNGADPCN